jgi:hypothetical protein
VRPVVLALLLLALTPAAAGAAPGLTLKLAKPEVSYGEAHALSGVLADGSTALPGQTVVLEGQRAPFAGAFRALAHTVTDARGAFRFAPKLDGNYKLRATVPALAVASPVVHAYTFPAFTLTFRALRHGRVRLYQRYRVPSAVRLTALTIFYLGPRKAVRSTLHVHAKTRRVRAGHFLARATVRIPAAWHRSFRYASCFPNSPGTGMGAPSAHCPKRFRF